MDVDHYDAIFILSSKKFNSYLACRSFERKNERLKIVHESTVSEKYLILNSYDTILLSVRWQAHRGCCEPEGPKGLRVSLDSEGPRKSPMQLILMLGLNPEVFNFHQKRNLGMCLPAYTICFLSDLQ